MHIKTSRLNVIAAPKTVAKWLPAGVLAFSALFTGGVQAAYPEKPVKIVLGFSAGGPTDGPARKIATLMSASLNTPVVVENKAGAGGKIAAEYVMSQPGDGYTLLLCSHVDAANAVLYRKISYSNADLQAISLISRYNYAVAVSSALPVNTIAELIAYAKKHPREVNYAQVGTGTQLEFLAKRFQQLAGIEMTAIPYKGTAEAMQDVLAGRTQFIIGALSSTLPLQDQGRLKVLAVTSAERIATNPKIPSLTESGVPIVGFGWLGLCAPKGTPANVIDTLNKHVVQAVASPDYQAQIKSSGSIPLSSTPAGLTGVITQTAQDAQKVITDFKISVD